MIQPSEKFLRCHPFVQRMEGGLSDDAADAGGINALASEREDYYRRIILRKPSQKVFERGWMRRAREMRSEALDMLEDM